MARKPISRTIVAGFVVDRPVLRQGMSALKFPWYKLAFKVETRERWTNQRGDEQESIEVHPCVLWGAAALDFHPQMRRGTYVLVEGRARSRSWVDEGKDELIRRWRTEIEVYQLFLEPTEELLSMAAQRINQKGRPQATFRLKDDAEDQKLKRLAAHQMLTVSAYVRQGANLDPFTHIYVQLPVSGDGWAKEWTRIYEDNLDGTYCPKEGAPPVAWTPGQPYATVVGPDVPALEVRQWDTSLIWTDGKPPRPR